MSENNNNSETYTGPINSSPTPTPSTSQLDSLSAFTPAYERKLPAIMAVKEDDLAVLNIDPHAAVTTVLGTLEEIKALREGMSAPTLASAPSVSTRTATERSVTPVTSPASITAPLLHRSRAKRTRPS